MILDKQQVNEIERDTCDYAYDALMFGVVPDLIQTLRAAIAERDDYRESHERVVNVKRDPDKKIFGTEDINFARYKLSKYILAKYAKEEEV